MRQRTIPILLTALVLTFAGCKKANDAEREREPIRVAIEQYLSKRSSLNLAAMDVRVGQVTITGNTAIASVEIQAKGAAPTDFKMKMSYALDRQGQGWVVRDSQPVGGDSVHPQGGSGMPHTLVPFGSTPAGPPTDGGASAPAPGAGKLPTGHPPIGEATSPPAKKSPAPQKK